MQQAFVRRALVASAALLVLFATKGALAQTVSPTAPTTSPTSPARKAPAGIQVHIDVDPALSVFHQTNDIAMVPTRVGRYGTALEPSYVFSPLCGYGGCDTRVEPGRHVLAIRGDDGALVQGPAVRINGPANIHGELIDRSGLRTAGLVGVIVSGVVGCGFVIAGSPQPPSSSPGPSPLAMTGLGVLVTGVLGFMLLALTSDSATFTVTPMTLSRPTMNREGVGLASPIPNGAALTFRF